MGELESPWKLKTKKMQRTRGAGVCELCASNCFKQWRCSGKKSYTIRAPHSKVPNDLSWGNTQWLQRTSYITLLKASSLRNSIPLYMFAVDCILSPCLLVIITGFWEKKRFPSENSPHFRTELEHENPFWSDGHILYFKRGESHMGFFICQNCP